MVLNLLNLYALIFALFVKIRTMSGKSQCYKQNLLELRNKLELADLYSNNSDVTKHLQNTSDGYDLSTTDYYTESYTTMSTTPLFDLTTIIVENATRCYQETVTCATPTASTTFNKTLFASMLLINVASAMLPFYITNPTNATVFNVTDRDIFDNTTDDWMDSSIESTENLTVFEENANSGDYDYDYSDDHAIEKRSLSLYNVIADFYANFPEGTNFSTSSYGNVSDSYATISTILDNITSTSWTDENITDYERKCSYSNK